MTGLTDFITDAQWEDVLTYWFLLIDDAYQALERRYQRWRRRGPQPRFADSEVITVGLLDDWMLAPAARKDGKATSALLGDRCDLHVFGDNAYHDPGESHLLALRHNVRLRAVPRKDARFGQWSAEIKR